MVVVKKQQEYPGYAILQTKFWQLDLSEWNKYEFEHISDMDLPTKPAANLFFEFSRSFGIWVGIGDGTEFGYIEGSGCEILVLDGIEL